MGMPIEKNLLLAHARRRILYPDIVEIRNIRLKRRVRPWIGFKGNHLFGPQCHLSGVRANVGSQIYARHFFGAAERLVKRRRSL